MATCFKIYCINLQKSDISATLATIKELRAIKDCHIFWGNKYCLVASPVKPDIPNSLPVDSRFIRDNKGDFLDAAANADKSDKQGVYAEYKRLAARNMISEALQDRQKLHERVSKDFFETIRDGLVNAKANFNAHSEGSIYILRSLSGDLLPVNEEFSETSTVVDDDPYPYTDPISPGTTDSVMFKPEPSHIYLICAAILYTVVNTQDMRQDMRSQRRNLEEIQLWEKDEWAAELEDHETLDALFVSGYCQNLLLFKHCYFSATDIEEQYTELVTGIKRILETGEEQIMGRRSTRFTATQKLIILCAGLGCYIAAPKVLERLRPQIRAKDIVSLAQSSPLYKNVEEDVIKRLLEITLGVFDPIMEIRSEESDDLQSLGVWEGPATIPLRCRQGRCCRGCNRGCGKENIQLPPQYPPNEKMSLRGSRNLASLGEVEQDSLRGKKRPGISQEGVMEKRQRL
ncbi:uncharacterized protein GIQ15_01997 [Arthroderma uncinatum]|uniref:uncharacterized protein n=1 Tax=Arthroderma uncinatum TaxID=74035 RepID=UPI00144AD391|nr:uncharacterized protein GIQ15_01997 [Arthroderma uncinatum]KAF3482673.1 hypothetical protein GIQ15_01997 [Arthroderma uncinatum]